MASLRTAGGAHRQRGYRDPSGYRGERPRMGGTTRRWGRCSRASAGTHGTAAWPASAAFAAEGAAPLTFDQTLLIYRQQSFVALAMWTATLTPALGSPEMQPPETSLEFIKRMSHAIDDWDALDSI